jgi:hypothetical protein
VRRVRQAALTPCRRGLRVQDSCIVRSKFSREIGSLKAIRRFPDSETGDGCAIAFCRKPGGEVRFSSKSVRPAESARDGQGSDTALTISEVFLSSGEASV